MKILVFSHYFPPEVNAPATRTYEHCREWGRAGHQVTVITCAPNHPRGQVYPGFRNCWFQSEQEDGIRVVRVWSYLTANEGFLRRVVAYLSYMVTAVFAQFRIEKPDIVVSTSPQFFCGLAGGFTKLLRRVPWVLEIRDLWPESIVSVGAMRRGAVIRLLERIERRAYRYADHVVSVTDGFVPHINARSGKVTPVSVIKNGVDLVQYQRYPDGEAVRTRFGMEGRFIAAYVGTHGMAHGLGTVIEAAELLRDDHRIGFLLVGDGAERAALQARAAALQLPNLHFAGQLPKSDMPGIWSATDVSMILLRKSDTFKTVLPSKMFEAMAMQCPLVLGVEGEALELLGYAQAGIGIEPESAEQLAAAVKRLAEDEQLAEQFGANGRGFVEQNFDRQVLAARMLDILDGEIVRLRGR